MTATRINEGAAGTDLAKPVKLSWETILNSKNLAEELPSDYLATLGRECIQAYTEDMDSRKMWEEQNADGMKLALQYKEVKSFPWTNCSNVKFPVVTIAALQFLARISILTKGPRLARCDFFGKDPLGKKTQIAQRISEHMSYQLSEECPEWIDQDECAKFAASIVGCAFKKTYPDTIHGTTETDYIPASHLVVDYFTKSLRKANRITQYLPLSENQVQENFRAGKFLKLDGELKTEPVLSNSLKQAADDAQGVRRPPSCSVTPYDFIEQHRTIDLDDDGYSEPYIVTVKLDTAQVVRVVANFFDEGDVYRVNDIPVAKYNEIADNSKDHLIASEYKQKAQALQGKSNHILRIDPQQYFSKVPFLPSPDGGFYGMGLGMFLGPLNESVNTIINQLIDNGTMTNLAGGFFGRGVKMKGGKTSFDPFEWKPVDSTGDDLRKNIMPLPVGQPSPILFQLLELLIGYSEKVSGATDIMTGISPGQNTPAETSRNTIEQGMKLFSGIYARMYRAFTAELRIRFSMNRLYLGQSRKFKELSEGDNALIAKDDYTLPVRVFPTADPAMVSEELRKQRAMLVYGLSKESPGIMDGIEARKMVLEANDLGNSIPKLMPDPEGPNALPKPVNPKLELEKGNLELKAKTEDNRFKLAIVKLQQEASLIEAKITELSAKAEKELAEANGVDVGHSIALLNAQIGLAKEQRENIQAALGVLLDTGAHVHKANIDHAALAMKEKQNDRAGSNSAGVA